MCPRKGVPLQISLLHRLPLHSTFSFPHLSSSECVHISVCSFNHATDRCFGSHDILLRGGRRGTQQQPERGRRQWLSPHHPWDHSPWHEYRLVTTGMNINRVASPNTRLKFSESESEALKAVWAKLRRFNGGSSEK
jgi:hypothetical protein